MVAVAVGKLAAEEIVKPACDYLGRKDIHARFIVEDGEINAADEPSIQRYRIYFWVGVFLLHYPAPWI